MSHARTVAVTLALALALPAMVPGPSAAQPVPGGRDVLLPGEYAWSPALAPAGPVAVIVSLPEQRAYVYRNGVRIGTSTVSTGRPGYLTPPGIYTVLQKRREHYSNLYDNAPMPFMQRLSWDGLALHAGSLPGYPASHGCVRLPAGFAERLFEVTPPGTVVVIADTGLFPPSVVSPGLFAPVAARTPGAERLPAAAGEWTPERSPTGPLTVVLSTRDRQLVVLRNAIEIGRVGITVHEPLALGTRAYVLLEGTDDRASLVVPDRPARRWLAVHGTDAGTGSGDAVRRAIEAGDILIPPGFALTVYGELRPGSTVIVTDEPLGVPAVAPELLLRPEPPGPPP